MSDEVKNIPGRSIANVVHRYKLGEELSDREYWLSRTPAELIAAVEMMRREVHGENYETEMPLQRVFRIVKLSECDS
ncbi:MAG: hypothetical protein ABJA67_16750 [Chthonomonadales bacterium]